MDRRFLIETDGKSLNAANWKFKNRNHKPQSQVQRDTRHALTPIKICIPRPNGIITEQKLQSTKHAMDVEFLKNQFLCAFVFPQKSVSFRYVWDCSLVATSEAHYRVISASASVESQKTLSLINQFSCEDDDWVREVFRQRIKIPRTTKNFLFDEITLESAVNTKCRLDEKVTKSPAFGWLHIEAASMLCMLMWRLFIWSTVGLAWVSLHKTRTLMCLKDNEISSDRQCIRAALEKRKKSWTRNVSSNEISDRAR